MFLRKETDTMDICRNDSPLTLCLLLWTCCSWPWTAVAAEAVPWDFESGNAGWQSRGKSVTVERVVTTGANGQRTSSLRIHGRIEDGWNYASSHPVPMTAGKLYRLSAWVRVERVGPGTPMPYLKCEFQSADRTREIGRARTEAYDIDQWSKWQKLQGEFPVPDGTRSCWLALEKGTNRPCEIDAYLADVRLEPIERFGFWDAYRLKPLPASLEKMRGVHPRTYLTSQRIAELREAVKTTHAAMWKKIRDQADRAVKRGPPAYILNDGHSGDEQLWQREVGNAMPVLAMAYAVSGEKRYLDSCPAVGLGLLRLQDLGAGPDRRHGPGRRASALRAGAGLRLVLSRPGRTGTPGDPPDAGQADFRDVRGGGHRQGLVAQVVLAESSLGEHCGDGRRRAGAVSTRWTMPPAGSGCRWDKFRRTMAALGPDGASHEGVGYWEYGVEYMLKFMDLARTNLDADLYGGPWWRNTARYAQYLTLPRSAWKSDNCIVDLADCPRGHWYGPDYLLRGLARRFQDGHAQWLAKANRRRERHGPGGPLAEPRLVRRGTGSQAARRPAHAAPL